VDPTERPSAAQLQEQPWLLTWWNKDQGMKKQLSGRSIDVNGNGNVGSDAGGCGGDGTGGDSRRESLRAEFFLLLLIYRELCAFVFSFLLFLMCLIT